MKLKKISCILITTHLQLLQDMLMNKYVRFLKNFKSKYFFLSFKCKRLDLDLAHAKLLKLTKKKGGGNGGKK